MSTKSTIFLTNDNEHCYREFASTSGNSIVLEMDKKNISIIYNTDNELIIEIAPGSELYDIILNIKQP